MVVLPRRLGLGVTVGLHWGLLALGVVHGEELYEEKKPVTYVFWTFAVTAMVLSWVISYRNPGYCPIAETTLSLQSSPECRRTPANIVPKVPHEEAPETHQLSENPLQGVQDCSVQLELSLEVSSSCKESEFQGISDPSPIPMQPRPEEISTLLPSLSPPPQAETSLQATSNTRDTDIPLRYCPLCNIEQRLRSKHCLTCRRCIARYDHHCPWLSTCIGEKNHPHFLLFLYCQCTELILGIALIATEVSRQESGARRWLGAGLIGTAVVLFLLLFVLCCYQTWLFTVNLTTWEHQSWKLITYLQTRKRPISPFSTDCKGNISAFCRSAYRPELTDWKISVSK